MKIIIPLIISILILTNSFGQSNFQIKDRTFHGFESEAEYGMYPAIHEIVGENWMRQRWESSGINWSYFFRINILQLGINQSFSLETSPKLGFRFGSNRQSNNFGDQKFYNKVFGIGSLHLPFAINYHIGKGATKNTTYKFGLTISLGREFRLDPLLYAASTSEDRIALEKFSKNYSLTIGFLREKKRLHQFFIRTIIMKNSDLWAYNTITFQGSYHYFYSPKTVSIGLRFYSKK